MRPFSKQPDADVAQSLPVLVTIFNTRLELLKHYLDEQGSPDAQRLVVDLRRQIGQIPLDSFSVRKIYPEVQRVWEDNFWLYLTQNKLDFLSLRVGPLLRHAPATDVQAATFTSKVERLKLQILSGKNPAIPPNPSPRT